MWIKNGPGPEIFHLQDGLDKVLFIASFIAALELLRHWPSINRSAATGAKNHPIHTDMTVADIFTSKIENQWRFVRLMQPDGTIIISSSLADVCCCHSPSVLGWDSGHTSINCDSR